MVKRICRQRAAARCQPLVFLWLDWLHPALTGGIVGLAMAFYQLLLQCVMCAIWGNDEVNVGISHDHSRTVSPFRLSSVSTSSAAHIAAIPRSAPALASPPHVTQS